MTDEQLANELNLSAEEAAIIIPKLTPEKRAIYEKLCETATDLVLWQQGVSPKPKGIIVLWDRKKSARSRQGRG